MLSSLSVADWLSYSSQNSQLLLFFDATFKDFHQVMRGSTLYFKLCDACQNFGARCEPESISKDHAVGLLDWDNACCHIMAMYMMPSLYAICEKRRLNSIIAQA